MSKIQVSFDWIWWLQPVHNIFLLVLAETGITGFLIFLFLIIKAFKNSLEIRNWSLVISLLAILLTGAADHYWLTLQQNQLIFAIILGLSWQK
jgi:O-antigen ligase